MTIVSSAQNFEDVLLWRALGDIDQGRYIDIGAQDPVVDSVSLAFYNAGWRGIHAEPTAAYANKLRQARPDEIVIEAAVTDVEGLIAFHEIKETGISTGDASIAAFHREHGHESTEIHVPTVRLSELFDLIGANVHWLKVDVEGMEANVLRSWGDHAQRPWVLVVESTYPNSQEPTEHLWLDEVLKRGYSEVFFDGLSRYFVHESHPTLRERINRPANVFDGFAVPRYHFSAALLRLELDKLEGQVVDLHAQHGAAQERLLQEGLARENSLLEEVRAAEAVKAVAQIEAGRLEERARFLSERTAELTAGFEAALARETVSRIEAGRLEERARFLSERTGELNKSLEAALAREAAARSEAERFHEAALAREAAARSEAERLHEAARATAARLAAVETDAANLRLEVERLNRDLALKIGWSTRADELLRGVRDEIPGRWTRIGQALHLQRPSSARTAISYFLDRTSFHGSGDQSAPPTTAEQIVQDLMRDDSRNPYLRAGSLDELLSWSDVEFVRCAYVTLLGRQPDPSGEAHFTQQIRAGVSKLDVLWRLRRSAEGPQHDPGIAGLDRALKRAALQRRPILGAFARRFRANADGDSRGDRALRALINAASVNQKVLLTMDRRLAAAEWSLTQAHERPAVGVAVERVPGPVATTAQDAFQSTATSFPELAHLRNQSPLASYFQDHVQ